MKKKKRRSVSQRYTAQRQRIARLLLLGWTAERIGKRLGLKRRTVTYALATPEFQVLFADLMKQHFKTLDARLAHLLDEAISAMFRMLRHRDWRAVDSAVEKVLRVHGRYIERLDISGTFNHAGSIQHNHDHSHHVFGVLPDEAMTDEMRARARELLQLAREQHAARRALPSRFQDPNLATNGDAATSDH